MKTTSSSMPLAVTITMVTPFAVTALSGFAEKPTRVRVGNRERQMKENEMTMTRYASPRNWLSRLQLGLSVLVLAASGVVSAQYFIRIDVPPLAPPDCNANSVFFGTTATISYNFPSTPNNQVLFGAVNGVPTPDSPEVDSISPASDTFADTINIAPLGSPAVPYTVVLQAFPAMNGNPVGTGAQVTVQCNTLGPGQGVATFSVVQAPATVVEYYHAGFDHYFITWMPNEIAILDAGIETKGWVRTGYSFKTYTTAQSGTSPVCRYYIPPGLGDSHFFGRGTVECNATGQKNPTFVLEDPAFMQTFLPVVGVCPANTTQVYRVFSNRTDANHRYMTDPAVRDQMVAKGWLAEGDGPDLVVMCAPQ
jgi:hypothetical protein